MVEEQLINPDSLPASRMLSLLLVRDSLSELVLFLSHLLFELDSREDFLDDIEFDSLEECEAILHDVVQRMTSRLKSQE